MGLALIAEATMALIVFGMYGDFGETPYKPRHARESFGHRLTRSARVWLGIALVGRGRVRARHGYAWRYPSGRQHQIRFAQ